MENIFEQYLIQLVPKIEKLFSVLVVDHTSHISVCKQEWDKIEVDVSAEWVGKVPWYAPGKAETVVAKCRNEY